MVPVFIVNFNRLVYVKSMLKYLLQIDGIRVIILDNHSSYPPLLEWYQECPVDVIRYEKNWGPRALWDNGWFVPRHHQFFCVTDPDLDLSGIPLDCISRLAHILRRNEDIKKCGFSLRLDDLDDKHPLTAAVKAREAEYWVHKRGENYEAKIATTFAMYRVSHPICNYGPAIRTAAPYQARHLPWYVTPETMSAEERYYYANLEHHGTIGWSTRLRRWMEKSPAP